MNDTWEGSGMGGGEGLTRAMLLADWTMSERMRCRIMCEPGRMHKEEDSPVESHPLARQGQI